MTGIPKPPEKILDEGKNSTITTTLWDTLREYPAGGEEDPQYANTIKAPERAPIIGDYASSGLIFSDMVGLAKDIAEEKNRHSRTSEEGKLVLLIFGGVCVRSEEHTSELQSQY